MTKLNETEKKSLDVWHDVLDALMKHLAHREGRLLIALYDKNMTLADVSLKALHRAAKTLVVFTNPNDD